MKVNGWTKLGQLKADFRWQAGLVSLLIIPAGDEMHGNIANYALREAGGVYQDKDSSMN